MRVLTITSHYHLKYEGGWIRTQSPVVQTFLMQPYRGRFGLRFALCACDEKYH
jgi:hypothetical protein